MVFTGSLLKRFLEVGYPGIIFIISLSFIACSDETANPPQTGIFQTESPVEIEQTPVVTEISEQIAKLISDIEFCVVPDPELPSSAFTVERGEPNGDAGHWVHYQCKEVCSNWRQCQVPAVELDHEAVMYNARRSDVAKQALAFVIDGTGGHIAFTKDGNKTLVLHQGGGAATYYTKPAAKFEQRSSLKTVMIRWEGGFISREFFNWGWFTRSAPGPSTIAHLNRRVAGIFAWIHENLTDDAMFGTIGCSIGTTATLGTVVWHGLDDIIDYQLLSGGTPMGDINATCGRRKFDSGYCDRQGVTSCTTDAGCQGEDNRCSIIGPITESWAFEAVVNHVHAAEPAECRVADVTDSTEPYPPFDQSSFLLSGKDIDIDHRIDLVVNLRAELDWSDFESISIGGDEHWGLGSYLRVFNHIKPRESHYTALDGHHCGDDFTDEAINLVISGMKAGI